MTCARLTDESLVDALFGDPTPGDRGHIAACPDCAARLREAETTLAGLRQAELPEPSPFYWAALRRNVRARVETSRRVWRWAPLAAAAAVLVAIVSLGPRPGQHVPAPEPRLPAWAALPPAAEDPALEVIEGALAEAPESTLAAAPPGGCSGLAPCLASLSESETRALVESLRSELGRVDS